MKSVVVCIMMMLRVVCLNASTDTFTVLESTSIEDRFISSYLENKEDIQVRRFLNQLAPRTNKILRLLNEIESKSYKDYQIQKLKNNTLKLLVDISDKADRVNLDVSFLRYFISYLGREKLSKHDIKKTLVLIEKMTKRIDKKLIEIASKGTRL